MANHLQLERLLKVAADDYAIFTLHEFIHLKDCADCFDARALRLRALNFEQQVAPPVPCVACGGGR